MRLLIPRDSNAITFKSSLRGRKMHELPITKSIFQIVLKHARMGNVQRVISVNLEIGALSDLQGEWVQRYFDYLSQGTVVEGAELRIHRVPAVFRCNRCQRTFEINSLLEEDLSCGQCHSRDVTLASGREYHVKNMEVQ
jgi:hydrogenase nickel incorporation protein HypA/HybF